MNIVERRRAQDGQIRDAGRGPRRRHPGRHHGGGLRREGRAAAARQEPAAVPARASSGMPADTGRPLLRADLRSPYGMVICAGPTGSGKTTTLYASLGEINSPERNIMTIEDPVEYIFPSINQIQINEAGRHHLRRRAAVDPAAGPRRHPGRRDPGRRDRADRRAVRADRALRAVVAARHRRGVGAAPAARHGHRDLPGRVVGDRRRVASGWSAGSASTAASPTSRRPRSWRSSAAIGGRGPDGGLHARRGLQLLRADRLPRADRRLRADAGDRRDPRAGRGRAPRTTRSARSLATRACGRCGRRRPGWSRQASRPSPRSSASIYTVGSCDAEVSRTSPSARTGNAKRGSTRADEPRARPSWRCTNASCANIRLTEKPGLLQLEITARGSSGTR